MAADPAALGNPMSHNEGFQLPLHYAVRKNLPEMVVVLLEIGADPSIRDTVHNADAIGWAEFFGHPEIVEILKRGRTP